MPFEVNANLIRKVNYSFGMEKKGWLAIIIGQEIGGSIFYLKSQWTQQRATRVDDARRC